MPRSEPIRLVVTDVDGTLVRQDKSLAPSTLEAARTLRARGVRLALVSSRPAHGLDVLIEPLDIDTPRAGFNGGEILSPNNELLSELTIPPDAARETVERMLGGGVDPWVFAGGVWFLLNAEAHYIPRERLSIQQDFVQVDDLTPHLGQVHKIMGTHTDFDLMGRMEAELRQALDGQAAVARSQAYYLDVTHAEANKGYAAVQLARLLDVPAEAMCCIGDMPNDVPMFSVCGLAIAMGNAPTEVQKRAHAVTGSNEADGWGQAIEKFVLPRCGT